MHYICIIQYIFLNMDLFFKMTFWNLIDKFKKKFLIITVIKATHENLFKKNCELFEKLVSYGKINFSQKEI